MPRGRAGFDTLTIRTGAFVLVPAYGRAASVRAATLAIYDTLGQQVARLPLDGTEVVWDRAEAADLASGRYIARVEQADTVLASTGFTRVR